MHTHDNTILIAATSTSAIASASTAGAAVWLFIVGVPPVRTVRTAALLFVYYPLLRRQGICFRLFGHLVLWHGLLSPRWNSIEFISCVRSIVFLWTSLEMAQLLISGGGTSLHHMLNL